MEIGEGQNKYQPAFRQKFLISYLYLIQGIFLAIPSTIILTYAEIPSYGILAYFSASSLPFSFKFISAPLIEKYTSVSYGRRKLWIVISLILSSFLIFFSSGFVADQSMQIEVALLWTVIVFLISIEDISTDALAIKELEDPELASFLQNVMQQIGFVIGSIVFLQVVTEGFLSQYVVEGPIMSVQTFVCGVGIFTIISAICIHFLYKQKTLKKEQQGVQHSFWEVVQHYKHFLDPKYRLCRKAVIFLLYPHGLIYFTSGFTVELIKNYNYPRDMLTTLQNLLIVPIFLITYLMKLYTSKYKIPATEVYSRSRLITLLLFVISVLTFVFSVTDIVYASVIMSVFAIISSCRFFIDSIVVNTISDSMFAGMYVTMMASASNLGRNSTIQLKVIDFIGYNNACIFGFCYTVVVLVMMGKASGWVKAGLQEQDMQKEKKN